MNFSEFLAWLVGPDQGGWLLVSVFAAVFLEDWNRWHVLAPKVKYLIIFAITAVLAVGATALQTRPDIVAAISPYWTPFGMMLAAWLATQGIHSLGQTVAAFAGKQPGR